MLGKQKFSPGSAAAFMALAFVAAACNPDSATTGPSGLTSKDFASNLRLVSGDQQVGPIAASLSQPIVVRVVDAGGQPVSGATVSFSVRAGGGSVNPAANVSGTDGIVQATWTMGTSLGENKAVALLSGAFLLDSALFKATATVGPANKFNKVSGDNQTFFASRALPAPLVVKVQDAFGNNLSGIGVSWAPGNLSGTVTATSAVTAADGTANATWTLGTSATPQTVTASVVGVTTTLTFSAAATPDSGRALTIIAGAGQSGAPSTALATALSALVTDQYGNVIVGASVSWSDSTAGLPAVPAGTSIANAQGIATTSWTLGRRLGTQLRSARVTGTPATNTGAAKTFSASAVLSYSSVVAGNAMACGIATGSGHVYCWGAGEGGQLGKGGTANSNEPTLAVPQSGDTLTGQIMQVREVSGGRNGFCSLTAGRRIFCWGRQLGGTTQNSPIEVTLSVTATTTPITLAGIAIAEDFGCVVTLAGDPACGGNDLNGQLGDSPAITGTAPGTFTPIGGAAGAFTVASGYSLVSAIRVGRAHSCAIPRLDVTSAATLTASQNVYCWGLNNTGQLGNSTTTTSGIPVALPAVVVGGLTTRFDSTTLSLGADYTCAVEGLGSVTTGAGPGRAWCWGANGFGQLGNTPSPRSLVPIQVAAPAGVLFSRLYAGEFHACAIESASSTTPGTAWCWGRNDFGQLGTGGPSTGGAPAPVIGLTGITSMSVGETSTCAMSAGRAYCWGDNQFGQLGTGSNASVVTPIQGRVKNQP